MKQAGWWPGGVGSLTPVAGCKFGPEQTRDGRAQLVLCPRPRSGDTLSPDTFFLPYRPRRYKRQWMRGDLRTPCNSEEGDYSENCFPEASVSQHVPRSRCFCLNIRSQK